MCPDGRRRFTERFPDPTVDLYRRRFVGHGALEGVMEQVLCHD